MRKRYKKNLRYFIRHSQCHQQTNLIAVPFKPNTAQVPLIHIAYQLQIAPKIQKNPTAKTNLQHQTIPIANHKHIQSIQTKAKITIVSSRASVIISSTIFQKKVTPEHF
jgi:hypothetical protein